MPLAPISSTVQESSNLVENLPVPPGEDRVHLIIRVRICLSNPTAGSVNTSGSHYFSSGYVCFNTNMLRNYSRLRQVLDPKFRGLGVDTSSTSYPSIIRDIIVRGLLIRLARANDGLYSSDVWLSCEVLVGMMETETDRANYLIEALVGMESETEKKNYRIAAIRELRIEAMLKIVEVEGGDEETCAICLEQLEVGLETGRMPCSHDFHADCIREWLRQNYICPVCRSIPTSGVSRS